MWHSPAPMRPVVALVAASTVLFSTRAASAAGFYLSDIGTRGMGRAGAFVASPDSLLAIHYNPAGLSHLQGVNAEASVTFVNMNVDFSRKCPCLIDRSDLQGMTADQWDAQLEATISRAARAAADELERGVAVEIASRASASPLVLPGQSPDPLWRHLALLEAVPLAEGDAPLEDTAALAEGAA